MKGGFATIKPSSPVVKRAALSGAIAHVSNQRRRIHGNQKLIRYVLALRTTRAHQTALDHLRTQYFPPKLNKLGAHVTIFHALPHEKLRRIVPDLQALVSITEPYDIQVSPSGAFRFKSRRGVGIKIEDGGKSQAIWEGLREKWMGFLSQQDSSHGFKLHYTITNLQPDTQIVQNCLEEVKAWEGSKGTVQGLELFRYDRGWWMDTEEGVFWFRGCTDTEK